jgi:hypothetical protein
MTTTEILNTIIKDINLTEDKKIIWKGNPYGKDFNNAYTAIPSNKMLFDQIQTLLYNECYSGSNVSTMENITDYTKFEQEVMAFNKHLSNFNYSKETFDYDWTVDQIDTIGNISAVKGNLKRNLHIGEFINDSSFGKNIGKQEQVKIFQRKEYATTQSGFYYVFSNTTGEDNQDMLVRFYFNIKADAVHELVEIVTQELNNYSIPFSFKCLNHPSFYQRKDSAVLYVDKRYFKIVSMVLLQYYKKFKDAMIDAIPLFTKQLCKGIAFAENPYKSDESFGTHCCKMITQGIMSAFTKKLPKSQWLKEIKDTIEKIHGYKDYEVLYTNPESNYPYNFNIFKN